MAKKQEDKNRKRIFRTVGYVTTRRSNRRVWVMMMGVFVMVFVFAFLMAKYKDNNAVDAANLGAFDPGYIISDYQMGNYNSMSEVDIQNFLTVKNGCNNRDYGYYQRLSANTKYAWHWANGHFVCLSEERFGYNDNEIGWGETAAHIIWQAAQDYRVNPQVLIVLLQKETGLITDPIPNDGDYRKATGYGCPDTAACSSKYYGFRNQIRNAAALFRTVLDGGWTNYPLGNNYIQYNPNSSCGGSWVNIRSLATSALYRYTPYQPNSTALAAGYGTGDGCSAYGNRNFYSYFEDWFGGITREKSWDNMETPRYMTVLRDTHYYNLATSSYTNDVLYAGQVKYFSAKLLTSNGEMCLRSNEDIRNNNNRCVLYSELKESEWVWGDMETPRYMEAKDGVKMIDVRTRREVGVPKKYEYYNKRVGLPDGDMCLRISGYSNNYCVLYSSLKEAKYEVYNMVEPRYLVPVRQNASVIDPIRNKEIARVGTEKVFYKRKITLPDNEMCLLVEGYGGYGCVRYSELTEVWVSMERPREMKMRRQSYKVDATNLRISYDILLTVGMQRRFVAKRFMLDGTWCLQTEYDYALRTNNCIRYNELDEV